GGRRARPRPRPSPCTGRPPSPPPAAAGPRAAPAAPCAAAARTRPGRPAPAGRRTRRCRRSRPAAPRPGDARPAPPAAGRRRLPELVITVTATAQGNLGLAAGNLIGGIAIQTMVLVVCDAAASGERPLTYLVGSLVPVVEGLAVVFVVGEVLLGALLPAHVAI